MLNYYQLISCLISFFKLTACGMEINMLTILIRIAIVGFLTPQGIEFVFFLSLLEVHRGNSWSIPTLLIYVYVYIYIDILYIYACNICIYVYKIISYCFSGHMNHSSKQIKTLGSTFYAVDSITDRRTSTIYNFWNCSCWCLGWMCLFRNRLCFSEWNPSSR